MMLASAISNPYRVVKNGSQSSVEKEEPKNHSLMNDKRIKKHWLDRRNKPLLVYFALAILIIFHLEFVRYIFIPSLDSNLHIDATSSESQGDRNIQNDLLYHNNAEDINSVDLRDDIYESVHRSKGYDDALSEDIGLYIDDRNIVIDETTENILNEDSQGDTPNEKSIAIQEKNLRDELYERSLHKVALARQTLQQNNVESNNSSTSIEHIEKPTVTRPDTCDKDDAFESIPIDSWIPPDDAPFDKKSQWQTAFNNAMASIRSSKLGGDNIRRFVRDQSAELRAIRHSLFCRKPTIRGSS